MSYVMHLFLNSDQGPQIFNERTDITSTSNGNRGYTLNGITHANTGDNLLEMMNIKINELKRDKLIANNYEITSVTCQQGLGNGANFLQYLTDNVYSTMSLSTFFTDGREYDRVVYINVYLDETADAQVRKKTGGKSRKKKHTKSKKIRGFKK
jgi:hypothetical protein